MTTYDVIIVGAGPAGAGAAGLLAARGRSVLLLEKGRFPREKLCGEFISPESQTIFERLGVRGRMLAAGPQPITRMVVIAPDGRSIAVPISWLAEATRPDACAWGLTRARMDAVMLDRARELGVVVREGFHVSARLGRRGALSLVEGKTDGETAETFAASLVIDASGRGRIFAPEGARPASSRLFGCKVHLRGVQGLGETGELYFFRDGYGGLADVEGGRSNLCFITTAETLRAAKGDRAKLLDLTLRTNPAARARLRGAEVDGDWLGTGPLVYGRQPPTPGVLAIGDAGAFIDPFTGSGILLALMSAELAAPVVDHALAAGLGAAEVARRYDALHRAQFGWRFRACALLRRMAFRPAVRGPLVTLLSRHAAAARLVARSTRQEHG